VSLLAVARLATIPAHHWYKRFYTDDIQTISRFRRVA
jgi:hypothetical protein